MIFRLKPYLVVLIVAGSLITFGCESVEQPENNVVDEPRKVLPADGLPDAKPIVAGLALNEERIQECKAFEQKRGGEAKSPPIVIPEHSIQLRAKPMNVRPAELEAAIIKYNFNLGDNATNGCFINAFQPNSDGTVTDFATKLMWVYEPSDALSRTDADEYIHSLNTKNFAGYNDWRIPTTEEMASLVEWFSYGETSHIDLYTFGWAGNKYMTADTYKYEGVERVWIVNSFIRLIEISSSRDEPAHVQAVRSL